jgi:diguanylate cyclase (GGDEF)-like protein
MTGPALPARLAVLLLGRDKPQRLRASYTLVALGAYVLFALFQHLEVLLGLIDPGASNALTAFNLAGSVGFYLVVRSGLNLRLAPSDPSLSLPFGLYAVVSVAWSYAITGPARGAVMGILILVILFGVFQLRPAQTIALSATGFVALVCGMAWGVFGAQAHYDPRVELIHLVFAAITTGLAAVLAVRFGRLRARLRAQKSELAQALEINRQLATRDALTGLLNRRAMVEMLAQESPRQRRHEHRVALAILDIDHFKRINDAFGHAIGDAVLQRFAELARAGLRQGDSLARWGGEEFLLLMPGTTPEEADVALERLRERVRAGDFGRLADSLEVSFSAGLTEYRPGEHFDGVVERADQALYRAKRGGRDRIEFAPAEENMVPAAG